MGVTGYEPSLTCVEWNRRFSNDWKCQGVVTSLQMFLPAVGLSPRCRSPETKVGAKVPGICPTADLGP